MAFSRMARLRRVIDTDRELQCLGWRRGHYLAAYYRGRLQDHLPGEPSPLVRRFEIFHQVTQRHAAVYLRTGPHGDDWTVLCGVWSHQDYYHPSLVRCRTVLDVGANIGLAAVWFHAWLPECQIACVEPDPRNLGLLQKNLAANGIHAKVFPHGAANRAGHAELTIGLETGWSSLQGTGLHDHRRTVPVTIRRIPDILDTLGWPTVDLLKLDVEGAEREILSGCHDWLGRVGCMVFEQHRNFDDQEMIRLFESMRWRLTPLGKHDESTYLAEPQ